jgi:hypothetical protein
MLDTRSNTVLKVALVVQDPTLCAIICHASLFFETSKCVIAKQEIPSSTISHDSCQCRSCFMVKPYIMKIRAGAAMATIQNVSRRLIYTNFLGRVKVQGQRCCCPHLMLPFFSKNQGDQNKDGGHQRKRN